MWSLSETQSGELLVTSFFASLLSAGRSDFHGAPSTDAGQIIKITLS